MKKILVFISISISTAIVCSGQKDGSSNLNANKDHASSVYDEDTKTWTVYCRNGVAPQKYTIEEYSKANLENKLCESKPSNVICEGSFFFSGEVPTNDQGEKCTEITGNLIISRDSTLTSLAGLENITSVGGVLRISENAALSSLAGLEKLTSVSGYLAIANNPIKKDMYSCPTKEINPKLVVSLHDFCREYI